MTSLEGSGSLVVSERTEEDISDAMEEVISSVGEGIVVWAELEMLEVVTVEKPESVENELMVVS